MDTCMLSDHLDIYDTDGDTKKFDNKLSSKMDLPEKGSNAHAFIEKDGTPVSTML